LVASRRFLEDRDLVIAKREQERCADVHQRKQRQRYEQ
jgi:hypothetical protein